MNQDQGVYQEGSKARLDLAVLDKVGSMVCDADLTLQIIDPAGAVTTKSTSDGTPRGSRRVFPVSDWICPTIPLLIQTGAAGPDYNGTARISKRVTLIPEFPGAVLTGDGATNTGTMTSDFCSNTNTNPPDINTAVCDVAGDLHNYYEWTTATATNDYDIWINWQVPSDFDEFDGTTAITFFGQRESSPNDTVTLTLYDDNDAVCGSATAISGTVGQWNNTNYADPTGCDVVSGGAIGPGDIITFRYQLSVGVNGESVYAGEIEIDYLAKF